ncbi:LPXTG cell wall anchor domain-containing protein [Vibrio navarrensis]
MKLRNTMKKIGIAVGASLAASSAFAESPVETAINTAVSTGQSNYGLVVVGLIGLAALGFGLRQITGSMR